MTQLGEAFMRLKGVKCGVRSTPRIEVAVHEAKPHCIRHDNELDRDIAAGFDNLPSINGVALPSRIANSEHDWIVWQDWWRRWCRTLGSAEFSSPLPA